MNSHMQQCTEKVEAGCLDFLNIVKASESGRGPNFFWARILF